MSVYYNVIYYAVYEFRCLSRELSQLRTQGRLAVIFFNKTVKGIKKKRKETGHFNTNNWTTDPLTLSESVVPLAKNRFTVLFRSPKYQGH